MEKKAAYLSSDEQPRKVPGAAMTFFDGLFRKERRKVDHKNRTKVSYIPLCHQSTL